MRRKRISWKTRYASAMLMLHPDLYEHAKLMGETNFASLFQNDHNILHETKHPDRDEFWNLTQRFIAEHREKTKQDQKIIAKGRRIRKKLKPMSREHLIVERAICRKLHSRGFDKRLKRKMDGTVVPK